jgi:hypothetical protein
MRRSRRHDAGATGPAEGNGTARPQTAPPPSAPPGHPVRPRPRRIPDDAVYRLHELQALLGLPAGTLPRELRLGRLRSSKRAGCRWVLGIWVREWLAAGEERRGSAGG